MYIRPATIEDAAALAHVRVKTWQTSYRGIIADEMLDNIDEEIDAQRWRKNFFTKPSPGDFVLAAVDENEQIYGFAFAGQERDGDQEFPAEIYSLYILPSHQRNGAGQALMAECARRLLAQGLDALLIWALEQNQIGCSFYRKMGGQPVCYKEAEIGGATHREVGFGWKDMRILLKQE